MLPLLLLLTAASPRVLVLDVAHSDDVRDDEAKTVGELLTASIAELRDVEVLSHGDIRALAGIAADQQDAGCDTSGCLAELAGAMDAEYVVSCRVSRLGDVVVANLALFDARGAKVGKRATRKSDSVGDVAGQIASAVDELFKGTGLRATRPLKKSQAPTPPLALAGGLVLGAAGVGAVIGLGSVLVGELALSAPASMTSSQYRDTQVAARIGAVTGLGIALISGATGGVLLAVGAAE